MIPGNSKYALVWIVALAFFIGITLLTFRGYLSPDALIDFANVRLC